MGMKYRFKNGDDVSGWLLVDALREAARSKIVTAETQIQQAGRDDWIPASKIPNLIPVVREPVEIEVKEPPPETPRHEHKTLTRPPESIHHLLHRALHTTIQVCAHGDEYQRDQFVQGVLTGLTTEGMMVEFLEFASIVYIPLTRVRSVVISANFPALGPPRKGEIMRIDVDSLPDLKALTSHSSKASSPAAV